MNELTVTVTRDRPAPELLLGRQGENRVTQIRFDCSALETAFGSGTAEVIHQRAGDAAPYPCAAAQKGSEVLWTVNGADTGRAGRGRLEVRWYVGEALAKSIPYATRTLRALPEAASETPEGQESWAALALDALAETDMLPAITDADGAILTDENNAILMM